MEKGQFTISLNEDVTIDLALLSKVDWQRIKNDAKFLTKAGHIKEPGLSYIAAFIIYLQDLEMLKEPFDPKKHNFI